MITKDFLLQNFEYKDGNLIRKFKSKNNKSSPGDILGHKDSRGYLVTKINKKFCQVHRLIYLYHHGYLPEFLDHKDGDRLNNKIENLREATKAENNRNAKTRKDNTSGVKGISWHNPLKKWRAALSIDGVVKHFGYYYDIDYAKFVVDAMRNKYHKEFSK